MVCLNFYVYKMKEVKVEAKNYREILRIQQITVLLSGLHSEEYF